MFEKVKVYFRNSPKRVGLAWFFLHVFFLLVAITYFVIQNIESNGYFATSVWEILLGSTITVAIFPIMFSDLIFSQLESGLYAFGSLNPFFLLAISCSYYLLFGFLVRASYNTASIKYSILFGIFSAMFFVNLVGAAFFVYGIF